MFGAVALMVFIGCGGSPTSEPSGSSTTQGDEHETLGESSGTGAPDPTLSDEACAAAGGAFGILARHSLHTEFPAELHPQSIDAPGLAVGPDGLWVSIVGSEHPDEQDPPGYGLQLGFDGTVLQPVQSNGGTWAGGVWWAGADTVLVSHCRDDVPGWTFIDTLGEPLAESNPPSEDAGCGLPPAAAWVSESAALVTWLDTQRGCDGGSACVRATRASVEGHGPVVDLFDAGDYGPGTSVSVAAGPTSALVAMLRVDQELELITQPVDHDGAPIGPAAATLLPPSPEPGDSPAFLEARVTLDQDDGFYVYVGGWGYSTGRMHIGAGGEVLEPIVALPPIVDIIVWGVYDNLDRIDPRPGGSVAIGGAVDGGFVQTMLSAISPEGDFVGHVVLPFSEAAATATDGERLWALSIGGGVVLYELGCVLP